MGLRVGGVGVEGWGGWVGGRRVGAVCGGSTVCGADTALVEEHGGSDRDGFVVRREKVVADVFDEETFTLEGKRKFDWDDGRLRKVSRWMLFFNNIPSRGKGEY